jgi:hypothetical protein
MSKICPFPKEAALWLNLLGVIIPDENGELINSSNH